jgi:hypothetical protein
MYMNRNISRVLAAAVASAGFAVVPMPAFGASLQCTSASFNATSDGNGNINVSCTSPGATPVCTLSASPSSLGSGGGTVKLTASNCGTISTWTKAGSPVGQTASSWNDLIPANTGTSTAQFTYTVNGDGGSASATVTEAAPGSAPPPPPPGGAISCAGYSKTIVIDLPWGAPGSGAPRLSSSGFGNGAIIVARFTTPSTTSTASAALSSGEWGDQPTPRTAALSLSPCDFSSPLPRASFTLGQQTPAVTYVVGGSSRMYTVLQPSTTYYFNIKNEAYGVPTCGSSSCNMFVELQKPNGL